MQAKLPYRVAQDYEELSDEITDIVAQTVTDKPDAVILVPGCNTPRGFYRRFSSRVRQGFVDISAATIMTVDSPIGLEMGDPRCFRMFMYENFYKFMFGPIPEGTDPAQYLEDFYGEHPNFVVPYVPIDANSAQADQLAYEMGVLISSKGYADLAFLGLGKAWQDNGELEGGHIAFNDPGSSIDSRARVLDLHPRTIDLKFRKDSGLFDPAEVVPTRAITLGVYELLQSRKILLAASGKGKEVEVKRLLEGEMSDRFTSTYLHSARERTLVLVDREAAGLLR